MGANDIQVGGDHYRGRSVQHWDVVDRNGIGYLEGVATKYVCRHREKNGLQDLRKAEHYVLKLIEEVEQHGRRPRGVALTTEIEALRDGHKLDPLEFAIVYHLLSWQNPNILPHVLKDIQELIAREEATLGNELG